MATIKVDVAPNIIDWVVNHAPAEKLTEDVLSELEKWKHGEKEPTFSRVEYLSKSTHIPLGYFFLQTPPKEELPVLQYRTVESLSTGNPSRNLVDTIHHMESVQEWMRNYLLSIDADKLMFIGSQKHNSDVLAIAAYIRKALNIPIDWFMHTKNIEDSFKVLRERMEQVGVLIMTNGIVGSNTHRSLNIDEFRAFTLIDDYAPLIFINANDSQGGKLFSLVHEMTHIWLGVDSFFNDRGIGSSDIRPLETICNAVAAEILVPNQLFVEKWQENAFDDNYTIEKLAILFKCGTTVIARRALDNGYIGLSLYKSIADKAIKNYRERKAKQPRGGGGDYYATNAIRLDNRFLIALDNSMREGKTLYTDAYDLTYTSRNTFSKLIEKVRGGR